MCFVSRYHLFFQNVTDSIEWKFGITWGHVTSKDLVYWQHLPTALEPGRLSQDKEGYSKLSQDKEGYSKWDADGCFTGCGTIDEHGKPTILYTGTQPAGLQSHGRKQQWYCETSTNLCG